MKFFNGLFSLAMIAGLLCNESASAQCQNAKNIRKTAFVVGVNKYDLVSNLHNPVFDAVDLYQALDRLHFNLKLDTNVDLRVLNQDIKKWIDSLANYDVALFYFAGHGAQVENENYLFPSNANTSSKNTLKNSTIRISDLLETMKTRNRHLNIIIADACRDNPLMGKKNAIFSKGFAPMPSPGTGAMLCFATGIGKQVTDLQNQRNSIFTQALIKYIESHNVPIKTVFDKVYDEVMEVSQSDQDPWVNEQTGVNFNYCLLVPDAGDADNDSTNTFLAEKYKQKQIPASEERAAYFRAKVDTMSRKVREVTNEIVEEIGGNIQANTSGWPVNFLTFTYSWDFSVENTYSPDNSMWIKFDASLVENTLKITIKGDNKRIRGQEHDLLEITERKLGLPHEREFQLSYYSPDWKPFKQQVKKYFLERASVLKPNYSN